LTEQNSSLEARSSENKLISSARDDGPHRATERGHALKSKHTTNKEASA